MRRLKKQILLFSLLCLTIISYSQTTLILKCEKAGELYKETNKIGNKENIEKLHLSGELNGYDFNEIQKFRNVKEIDLELVSIKGANIYKTHKENEIPENAFRNLKYLTNVNLPQNIETINDGSFVFCVSLKQIVFPNTLSSLGESIFSYCDSLKNIFIGKNIKQLNARTFEEYKGNITIDEKNPNFIKIDDVIFNKDKTELIYCPPTKKGDYVIPKTVKEIGEYAFSNCNEINNITFPKTLTFIGNSAFYECNSITKIVLPDNIKFIGERAFSYCRKLQEISIPQEITSIENYLFQACISLKNIVLPDSIKSIGNYSFYACRELTKVNIPPKVESIGNYTFQQCLSIKEITIPNSVKNIGDNAFLEFSGQIKVNNANKSYFSHDGVLYDRSNNILLHCPIEKEGIYILPQKVLAIDKNAFKHCSKLTKIVLPDGIERIENNAFEYCYNLQNINLPSSLSFIGKYAFNACNSLESIIIPNSIKSINYKTFSNSGVKNIQLPESLVSIEELAFYWCFNLQTIRLPSNIKEIGRKAFSDSRKLSKIYCESVNPNQIKLGSSVFNGLNKTDCELIIPNGCLSKYRQLDQWNEFKNLTEK